MKKIFSFMLGLSALCCMTSCSPENDSMEPSSQSLPLSLSVQTGLHESRALIETDYLPNASEIGVTVTNTSGGNYDGLTTYRNIKFTASGSDASQTWTGASSILLSSTKGNIYAYYPYSSAETTGTTVAVETASQTDYLYATPVTGQNDATIYTNDGKVSLTMKHALSAIRLKIKKGTYTGSASLTNVSVKGAAAGTGGTMDITDSDGSNITATGGGTAVSYAIGGGLTLTTTEQNVDVIVVPTGTASSLLLTLTIDGEDYTVTTTSITLEQGYRYDYTLTLDGGTLALSDVKVGDWSYNTSGNISVDMGYDVTLAGTLTDIAFSNTVSGGVLTIKAVPMTDDYYVKEVTKTGTATLEQSLDETTGIRTITVSAVTSDVTITFDGTKEMEKPLAAADATTGVYAVYKSGSDLYLHTYDQVDTDNYTYIGVGLIVTDAPTPQYLMIEKNGESNTTSIKAAYTADGASNTGYTYFYWGMYGSDNSSITNYTSASSVSSYGYIPLIDGTYYSTSATQLGAYTTWTGSYALNDWNGKANTAALIGASDTDSYTTYANMGTYVSKFNATSSENQGYTDWYIPSCGQLALIHTYTGRNSSYGGNVSGGINEMLTKIGGTTFNTSNDYWSSSEYSSSYGWYVYFLIGYVYGYDKNDNIRVRLVRDLK